MSNASENVGGGLYNILMQRTIAQSKTNHDRNDVNRSKEGGFHLNSF